MRAVTMEYKADSKKLYFIYLHPYKRKRYRVTSEQAKTLFKIANKLSEMDEFKLYATIHGWIIERQ